jgi:exopolyphosphatase / guanosine-5'-triphosphate,3'-diphosphate pyrophosphatase
VSGAARGPLRAPRYAVIDVGSNSVLLLTVEVESGGAARVVDDAVATTRLGAGLRRGGTLDRTAGTRTADAVATFAARARAAGAQTVWAFATGAVRDAADGDEFVRALAARTGVPVEIVPGEREAALAWEAVRAGLDVADGRLLVCDVGGRTTELVLDGSAAVSLPLGALALTEAHGTDATALATAIDAVVGTADVLERARRREARVAASGGTATALGALALGLVTYAPERVHGHRLSVAELTTLAARLAALSPSERAHLPGLDPDRGAILPAGAAILARIVTGTAAPELTVSDHGVRHAYLGQRLADAGVTAELRTLRR